MGDSEQTRKRERQAAAVRKLASLFAKVDGGSSAAQQDERRTLELIRSVTSESEVRAVIDQRVAQLDAVPVKSGARDVGQTYNRILAADSQKAVEAPAGAAGALRWLVDQYLPGGVGRKRSSVRTSPLNNELLSSGFWLKLSAGVDVKVCDSSGTAETLAAESSDMEYEASSGVPFAIAAAASVAVQRLLPTPHLPWLGAVLALSATILAPGSSRYWGSAGNDRTCVAPAEAERVVGALRGPGYAIAHSPSWSRSGQSNLQKVQTLMRQLKSSGWPAAFCFVFDEAWELLDGMWGVAEQVLGPGCVLEPSVFAWALDPVAAKRAEQSAGTASAKGVTGKRGYIGGNFGLPHRDFSYDEAYAGKAEDGADVSNVAQASVREESRDGTDVVPAEFDSCFDKSGAFSHLRAATARADEDEDTITGSVVTECRFDLTAARPLAPAEPGDVCMWAGNSIHWGARASADSEAPPRSSIAVTFCRADVKSVHDVSGKQLLTREKAMTLNLAERLSLIARSLLMHQQWYDLDAGLPATLLAAKTSHLDGSRAATAGNGERLREVSGSTDAPDQVETAKVVPKADGKLWLDAAKAGKLDRLQEIFHAWVEDKKGDAATILSSQGSGTSYSFTGNTALHWASAKGHLNCVTWLLAEGSKVGVKLASCTNHSESTPLHSASANGRAEAATLLLQAGADPTLQDDCDETPLDVAKRFGRDEVVALLCK